MKLILKSTPLHYNDFLIKNEFTRGCSNFQPSSLVRHISSDSNQEYQENFKRLFKINEDTLISK